MTRTLFNTLLLLLLLFFCVLMAQLSIPYFSKRYDVDFLLTKQKIIHLKHWRYAFYVHVTLSIFAMIAGLTQFSKVIIHRYKKIHRRIGYVYVADILLFAGPSGLILAWYANGLLITKFSFIILSVLWMLFTWIALRKALRKDFIAHRQWMIRSFALTLSAVTLRLLAFILPYFSHYEAKAEYNFISWASWTLNLAIAELIILYRPKVKSMS